MQTNTVLTTMLDAYEVSHQNRVNRLLHKVCVPAILWSLFGLLYSLPLDNFDNFDIFDSVKPALLASACALAYYFRLSIRSGIFMACVLSLCWATVSYVGQNIEASYAVYGAVFFLAWVGQFYGHKLEGKKPSFLEDLRFLLIGPLWVARPFLET